MSHYLERPSVRGKLFKTIGSAEGSPLRSNIQYVFMEDRGYPGVIAFTTFVLNLRLQTTAVSRKRKATDQAVLHQTGCHQESDIRQKK